MSKLEVFQNGVFSNTGEPVFQIGTKQEDGTYVTEVFDLMGKGEAEAKLNELQPPAVEKKAAPKKAAPKVKIPPSPYSSISFFCSSFTSSFTSS